MYKSGFAHTENISQDSNIWTTGSVNGKACFYLDPDYCKTNAKVQNRRDFSYVISCVGSENAFFTKTLHVAAYTNYVVNVMVKSTFINESASTSDFSILPHYIKVTSGSSVIAASIDCVGISDDWSELSVGFYSGSNTTVRFCFWFIRVYIIHTVADYIPDPILRIVTIVFRMQLMRWLISSETF